MKLELNNTEFLALFSLLERSAVLDTHRDDFKSIQSVTVQMKTVLYDSLTVVQQNEFQDWYVSQQRFLNKVPDVNHGCWSDHDLPTQPSDGKNQSYDKSLEELFNQTENDPDYTYPKKSPRSRRRRRGSFKKKL